MPSRKLLPFLQGELDGLCGIYGVVNSVRWALISTPRAAGKTTKAVAKLSDQECVALFNVLLSTIVTGSRGLRPIWDGVTTNELVQLLQTASKWLIKHRSLHLSFNRPFHGKPRGTTSELHRSLAAHLAKPGSASIVGTYHPWLHWSVVTTTAPDRLMLCDSYGGESVHTRALIPRGEKRRGKSQPRLVFFLTVGEAPPPAAAASNPTPSTAPKASPTAASGQS
jgi:hypothetical protein